MAKRFLTVFWLEDTSRVHLYKDVGAIPLALAKYCGWESTFAYSDANEIISDKYYEQYVKLEPIHLPKLFRNLEFRHYKYVMFLQVLRYLQKCCTQYDVVNFYHLGKPSRMSCWFIKKFNSKIKTYVKMDMGQDSYVKIKQKCNGGEKLLSEVDLFTVETERFSNTLDKLPVFKGKIKYLPNGFFSDLVDVDTNISKENIILTVGRLGSYQKNTELLVNAYVELREKLKDWKLYLVGPTTKEFDEYILLIFEKYPELKDRIILTGNISAKERLYSIYAKSKIFVLTSHWEGFPLVIPEAMYFKNFVISTNCFEAIYEILGDEKYGVIVAKDDKEQLKESILNAINNPKIIDEVSDKAREYADNNLDWKALAKKLEQYFSEC